VTELRVEYHQRLNDIDAAVQRMLSIVEQDILTAGTAFLDADVEAAAAVEANDDIVADTYQQVEQLVMNQFVRQAPAAGELRFLLTVFRMVPELTGAHERAEQIARAASRAWPRSFPTGYVC
jgi:phosphate uptake regulator